MLEKINARFVAILCCFLFLFILWADVWYKLKEIAVLVYEIKEDMGKR